MFRARRIRGKDQESPHKVEQRVHKPVHAHTCTYVPTCIDSYVRTCSTVTVQASPTSILRLVVGSSRRMSLEKLVGFNSYY